MDNSNNLIHSFNHTPDTEWNFNGLTKREYYAGLAMQGLLSNTLIVEQYKPEYIAEMSINSADELLKQLKK